MAGIGQLKSVPTLEKKCEKGVALSRASAHQVRETYRTINKNTNAFKRGTDGKECSD